MNILFVDDEKKGRAYLSAFLREIGHTVSECGDGQAALDFFKTQEFQIVLTDIKMPGLSGIALLHQIRRLAPGQNVSMILFTGYADLQTAAEALRFGAYDYLQKPIKLEELVIAIERVAEHQTLKRENALLTEQFDSAVRVATKRTAHKLMHIKEAYFQIVGLGDIVIYSENMQKVYQQAQMLHADRSVPVLIQGETGTGKKLIARYIHYGEEGGAAPFVDLNCAALAPTIFESELFGHEAGAYTGILLRRQKGKIAMAMGGTLFLDEITELPIEIQGKLLRLLQEKNFYRVGGLKKIRTDVRIICAANVDIEHSVERGAFRRDLFYRLNVARIDLPPLRQRRDDIIPLAEMFLTRFAREKRKGFKRVGRFAGDLLLSYEWPGNIRELKNMIEWSVLMHDDTELKPEHLRMYQNNQSSPKKAQNATGGFVLPPVQLPLKPFIDEILFKALEKHHGNKAQTAQYLDIPLRTLYHRLKNLERGT